MTVHCQLILIALTVTDGYLEPLFFGVHGLEAVQSSRDVLGTHVSSLGLMMGSSGSSREACSTLALCLLLLPQIYSAHSTPLP